MAHWTKIRSSPPEGRRQGCVVVRPLGVHPSTPDGGEQAGESVESLVAPEMPPPAPEGRPPRLSGPCTHRWTDVATVLPPALLGPAWANRLPQTVKAVARGASAPIGILTRHQVGLLRRECPRTLRPSGGQAGFEPVGWRRPVPRRAALIGIARAGDGRLCSLPPGLARLREEERREERADTTP
jgi:hypothetical protein